MSVSLLGCHAIAGVVQKRKGECFGFGSIKLYIQRTLILLTVVVDTGIFDAYIVSSKQGSNTGDGAALVRYIHEYPVDGRKSALGLFRHGISVRAAFTEEFVYVFEVALLKRIIYTLKFVYVAS